MQSANKIYKKILALQKSKMVLKNDILSGLEIIRNCSKCKNCFIGLEDEIKKEINDELNNNEEELKTWDNLYSKIKNWEKVTTCREHIPTIVTIEKLTELLVETNCSIKKHIKIWKRLSRTN